jgi:hypothetical protein
MQIFAFHKRLPMINTDESDDELAIFLKRKFHIARLLITKGKKFP